MQYKNSLTSINCMLLNINRLGRENTMNIQQVNQFMKKKKLYPLVLKFIKL